MKSLSGVVAVRVLGAGAVAGFAICASRVLTLNEAGEALFAVATAQFAMGFLRLGQDVLVFQAYAEMSPERARLVLLRAMVRSGLATGGLVGAVSAGALFAGGLLVMLPYLWSLGPGVAVLLLLEGVKARGHVKLATIAQTGGAHAIAVALVLGFSVDSALGFGLCFLGGNAAVCGVLAARIRNLGKWDGGSWSLDESGRRRRTLVGLEVGRVGLLWLPMLAAWLAGNKLALAELALANRVAAVALVFAPALHNFYSFRVVEVPEVSRLLVIRKPVLMTLGVSLALAPVLGQLDPLYRRVFAAPEIGIGLTLALTIIGLGLASASALLKQVLGLSGAERLLVAPMTISVFVAAVAAWRFCNESATLLSGGIAGSFGLLFGIGLVRARRRWINLVHDEVPDRFQSENGFDVR